MNYDFQQNVENDLFYSVQSFTDIEQSDCLDVGDRYW